ARSTRRDRYRQRYGVHEPGVRRLGVCPWRQDRLRSARQTGAELLRRELQRHLPRRLPEPPLVHLARSSQGADRIMETRVQHGAAALVAQAAYTRQVCCASSERWPGVGPNHQPGCQVISGAALGVSSAEMKQTLPFADSIPAFGSLVTGPREIWIADQYPPEARYFEEPIRAQEWLVVDWETGDSYRVVTPPGFSLRLVTPRHLVGVHRDALGAE